MENKIVIYQGKRYILLQQYTSDFCEIQDEIFNHNIILIHISDLTFLD